MERKNFKIFNKRREPIRGDVCIPDYNRRYPVIVLCHGFKGFKDWGFFPFLSELLCKKGFIVVKFNFSGSGVGEDMQNFTELDRFASNTYSKELEDLERVLDELEKGNICEKFGYFDKIGLLGHSRGGGITILKAAVDKRIKALVTWSSIATVERHSFMDVLPLWKRQKFIEVPNTRTGQMMRLNLDVVDDIEQNSKTRLNIVKSAARLDAPTMLIHGENDESVPVNESRQIFDQLHLSRSRIEIIPQATHTYGAVHPFTGPTPELKKAISLTQEWFTNFLK
ncbi:MAG TPA: alpha/beta fold hydrolase [bacterium]|nr:alpha/beta fold hydrolase [bacterium]HMW32565.1 alpha/beta fold hydrolase [bacterium]HMW37197.1 alpha/beta fold hydrolase [bacterium]HMY34890.1 alpha/beta fold hydrolase [bacterium]HMZ04581.1 alpha/beta fold hydrolase [bacterium]